MTMKAAYFGRCKAGNLCPMLCIGVKSVIKFGQWKAWFLNHVLIKCFGVVHKVVDNELDFSFGLKLKPRMVVLKTGMS
jgi:hypothetical protein